jgi:hypothetical protein
LRSTASEIFYMEGGHAIIVAQVASFCGHTSILLQIAAGCVPTSRRCRLRQWLRFSFA